MAEIVNFADFAHADKGRPSNAAQAQGEGFSDITMRAKEAAAHGAVTPNERFKIRFFSAVLENPETARFPQVAAVYAAALQELTEDIISRA